MHASPKYEQYLGALGEVVAETLWPTRCAICGELGQVLCDACRAKLSYIDLWKACPKCGSPNGMNQCTECNSFSLQSLGRKKVPFSQGVSAVVFDKTSARIVRTRKDANERRLATHMAYAIASAIPPEWLCPTTVLTYIPSTQKALRRRGFCHGKELGKEAARFLRVPCEKLLEVQETADQRMLSRTGRALNTRNQFRASRYCKGRTVIVVDDVYTTGSTSMAASDALLETGALRVYVATFARV